MFDTMTSTLDFQQSKSWLIACLLTIPDDWYNGMLLPKGSTVWISAWSIHQNENIYPDHDRFNPDRFVNHPKLASEYAISPDWEHRDKFDSRFNGFANIPVTSFWLWSRQKTVPRHSPSREKHVAHLGQTTLGF